MEDKRIIKKYPNRRLYDTEVSKYITLEDIKKLVLNNKEFIVIDVKSDEDLTRTILLQIITEQEDDGEPLFTTQALSHIIRYYIQKSINLFVMQQKELQDQLQSAVMKDPITALSDLAEQNLEIWRKTTENFFKTSTSSPSPSKKSKK